MDATSKSFQAENFVDIFNSYSKFCEEFITTFNLNCVQRTALTHLCTLAEEYGKAKMELKANNLTADEMFAIYYG